MVLGCGIPKMLSLKFRHPSRSLFDAPYSGAVLQLFLMPLTTVAGGSGAIQEE